MHMLEYNCAAITRNFSKTKVILHIRFYSGGATTLSIMTLGIMTFSKMTLSITALRKWLAQHLYEI
jgi:hypothetical protein